MTITRQLFIKTAAICLISVTGVPGVLAQQETGVDQAVPCLKLSRIQDVDIIDSRRIVFQSGINDYYLNTLPYACNGLKLNDSFMYQTSLNEICNVDVITVLNDIGPDYNAGVSCGLGKFEPVSKEDIKKLKSSL